MDNIPFTLHNLAFAEGLYADYLRDPASVPEDWRRFFQTQGGDHFQQGPSFQATSVFNPAGDGRNRCRAFAPSEPVAQLITLQHNVDQLIRNFRVRAHIAAHVNPLGPPPSIPPEIEPSYYGFTEADLDRQFSTSIPGPQRRSLREILALLQETYCRSIGAQFMHIDDLQVREWLQRRMESTQNRLPLSRATQLRILTRLTDAVIFEEFIQRRYLGAKRFSLEGAESLIPLLDLAIEKAGEQGITRIVLGMAHRGRLNVLANIMHKSPQQIFREFEDRDPEALLGRGDVKYHLGYNHVWETTSGAKVKLSLCFNPSHLEFVNPVALGRLRAKQDRTGDDRRERGLAILIHGDAAFAGEGIVQESLNLSELPGYRVGGAIHIIVNNQIGFTTSPEEGRSSVYATDVAKLLQSPILHVNGEDPEAVAQVIDLAMDFRREFKRDVFIDMYGYRRHGHNETDEPTFTHPILYRTIRGRKSVREGYLDNLLTLGEITREEADRIAVERRRHLEEALSEVLADPFLTPDRPPFGVWEGYRGGPEGDAYAVDTAVGRERLAQLTERLTTLPPGFRPHPKLERFMEARRAMGRGEAPLDWSAAEALAFASLVAEGVRVRLTGQDTARGTFSQRHAILYDVVDGHPYIPGQHVAEGQAPFKVYNSPLSEAGALGFEYGYSLDYPSCLVLWEAQFGDFVNVAQVIVDQFLASGEDKWRRWSGLTLLLPHGFEGQGPEHSSARLERFLQLAAEDNLQVVIPSTPAQYFHCLRRQALTRWRKPLIVLTPKSLLRHPRVVSPLDDFTTGGFQRVLPDALPQRDMPVSRVLLCSGKLYYDLEEARAQRGRQDIAILRLEQLYPLPDHVLIEALAPYPDDTPVIWVQEEPANMGAWPYLHHQYCGGIAERWLFLGVCRPASASPATGSTASHRLEQERLVEEALGG